MHISISGKCYGSWYIRIFGSTPISRCTNLKSSFLQGMRAKVKFFNHQKQKRGVGARGMAVLHQQGRNLVNADDIYVYMCICRIKQLIHASSETYINQVIMFLLSVWLKAFVYRIRSNIISPLESFILFSGEATVDTWGEGGCRETSGQLSEEWQSTGQKGLWCVLEKCRQRFGEKVVARHQELHTQQDILQCKWENLNYL